VLDAVLCDRNASGCPYQPRELARRPRRGVGRRHRDGPVDRERAVGFGQNGRPRDERPVPGHPTARSSNGVRAQCVMSWPGTCASHAAIVPPIAPGLITAIRVVMKSEAAAITPLRFDSGRRAHPVRRNRAYMWTSTGHCAALRVDKSLGRLRGGSSAPLAARRVSEPERQPAVRGTGRA
jgi:hypothetical protein